MDDAAAAGKASLSSTPPRPLTTPTTPRVTRETSTTFPTDRIIITQRDHPSSSEKKKQNSNRAKSPSPVAAGATRQKPAFTSTYPIDRSPERKADGNNNNVRFSNNDAKKRSEALLNDLDDGISVRSSDGPTSATDKFLDILEERVCTSTFELNSPSLSEIEKRIEESWKEIENKTSQLFNKCRSSANETSSTTSNENTGDANLAEGSDNSSPFKKLRAVSCGGGNFNKRFKDDDEDDDDEDAPGAGTNAQALALTCAETPFNWQEEKQQQQVHDDSRDDDFETDQDDVREKLSKAGARRYNKRGSNKDAEIWKASDRDLESLHQNTFDLNSYTGSYLKRVKEQTGDVLSKIKEGEDDASCDDDDVAAFIVGESLSDTIPNSASEDYDASTLTTMQTQSLASLKPPSLAPPPSQQALSNDVKTSPIDMSLTIFEPTNASSLLVKNTTSKQSERQEHPMRLTSNNGNAIVLKNPFAAMPDDNPNFQRRCFSPGLKKNGMGFGTLGSVSTSSSTCHTEEESRGYGSQYQANSHHAYIAYFHRGIKADGAMRLYEHPTPPAFPTLNHEIVVRVAYSTISHTDCSVRRGKYWGDDSEKPLNLPIIPGVAFSGYISQLGRPAMRSGLRFNDRVLSLVRVGANARHLCISRDHVVTVPDGLKDDKRLACLPEVYLGAFQALHMGQKNGARYKQSSLAGKTVLVLGGATILGKALIELCHAGGAYAVYATGKQRHFPMIEEARALPLNRDTRHWYSLLMGRIDLVIGLDQDSYSRSEASAKHLEVLSHKGRAVLMGSPESTCDANIGDRKRISVYNVFDSWDRDLKQAKRDLSHLCKLLADGAINPDVLETIPLSHIAAAQDAVENRDFSSFLLCDPWIQTKRQADKVVPNTVVYSETADVTEGGTKSAKSRRGKFLNASTSSFGEIVAL